MTSPTAPHRIGSPTVIACATMFATVLCACAAEDASLPPPGGGTGAVTGAGPGGGADAGDGGGGPGRDGDLLEGPCPLGATAECTVHHENGCASGLQYCVDGAWSDCVRSVTRGGTKRALSDESAPCGEDGTTANVCDPECRGFDATPPDLGSGGTGLDPDWQTGDLGDLPASVIEDGIEEPCNDARDCQFDHYCDEATARCQPFIPGQAVAECESGQPMRPDITLGVPCGDTVPLCNRGPVALTAAQTDAIELKWRPNPNPSMEGCNIGASTVCDVPATELAPGACISVPCAMPSGVHVFADYAANGECECGNNWTYNVDGACGEPSCGGTVGTAAEVPLTLFLTIDTSGSMDFHRDCPYSVGCSGACDSSGSDRNCTGSCSGGVCSTGRGPDCCWDSANNSRWDSVKPALDEFVRADASAGLGVVMRFWPTGRCQSNACDAVSPFAECEAGTCAFSPCEGQPADLPTGDTLSASCNDEVDDVCDDEPRCCGGWPGNCAADPCQTRASTLSSCDNNQNPDVRDVCNQYGYERCCGGAFTTSGSWGLDQSPCTVSAGSGMRCRNGFGNTTSCTSGSFNPPAGSRARIAKTVCASTPSCCSTGWTAACRDAFATAWEAYHGAPPCSPTAWDASCVAELLDQAGASACTKSWDAACADAYLDEFGSTDGCNRPSVPEASTCTVEADCPLTLTDAAAPTDTAEQTFLAALAGIDPDSGTPSAVALEGAADFCRKFEQQKPGERCVVVFVSDGAPSQCGDEDDVLAASTQAYDDGDGVYVYSISIPGVAPAFMHDVAENGGTGQAFIISPDATATQDFLDALQDIRNAFACSYTISASADPELVTVRWNDGGSSTSLTRVDDVTDCGASGGLGYYHAGPGEIVLCADACETVRAESGSNISIEIACSTPAAPVVAYDEFTAAGECTEAGTRAQWTLLLYTADVPAPSTIEVAARTRFDASAAWSEWIDVVTITDANESSSLADPTSLLDSLGGAALAEDIELRFTTTVEGGAPSLLDYEVHYTCVDTE